MAQFTGDVLAAIHDSQGATMQLLADRFVMTGSNTTLDLATGDTVVFRLGAVDEADVERRWAIRCDTLYRLHHPTLARLIDYGAIGRTYRFEAWRCGPPYNESALRVEHVRRHATDLLRASGLTVGSPTAADVRMSPSGLVLLPDANAGYPCRALGESHDVTMELRAVVALERRAVHILAELFERAEGRRPRFAALSGPTGAGKRIAVDDLARIARLHGFVPLARRVVTQFVRDLSGRRLFIIDRERGVLGWDTALQAALASPHPHVALFVGREDLLMVDGVALEPFSADVLASALNPRLTSPADLLRARRIAVRAGGWPGRFVRRLWGENNYRIEAECAPPRAAEQSAVYGCQDQPSTAGAGGPQKLPPFPGLAALRGRVEAGVRLIKAGRHARGERELRRAVGGLTRRCDWANAGEGCLALARLLMRRGRLSDAQLMLQDAAAHWSRSGERLRLVDVAILRGEALIDLARVEEAEALLSTAVAAARSDDDRSRLPHALIGLARALFWDGRYAEAEEMLRSVDEPAHASLALSSVATKVAVGRRSLDVAITRAGEAISNARRSSEPRRVAIAAYVAAFAHLAVGDLVAVERDVTESVAAARSAHDPLQAARSRLILVESLRRSGRVAAATALLNRLNKIPAAVLPPIVRARRDLLRDVLSERAPVQQVLERHIAATGLKALGLHVGTTVTSGSMTNTLDPTIDDIVEILQICQRSDDDTAILIDVCRRTRGRLRAAAVALASLDGSSCRIVASDGSRVELTVADRAVDAGITIAPHRGRDRIEAAAPVRYGGGIIGVLVSRWTIATPHDLSGAASLLTGAAAAVGPILSAAMARRSQSSHPATIPLLGISSAMAAVRDAVERAATAPFAVLVEGAIDPQ